MTLGIAPGKSVHIMIIQNFLVWVFPVFHQDSKFMQKIAPRVTVVCESLNT